ncbi:MAG: hypothetical protein PVF58_01530 [Candidatus Methanofastidiosia archaeon]|jgi:hypothetical protein
MVKDMRRIFAFVVVGIFLFGMASVAQAVCDCTTQEIPLSENFDFADYPPGCIINGDGGGHGGPGGGPVPG